jgi:hypothetical protein
MVCTEFGVFTDEKEEVSEVFLMFTKQAGDMSELLNFLEGSSCDMARYGTLAI